MLSKFFWMASGSDPDVLSNCSRSEQIKHAGIGGTVFFTAVMAAIASAFAIMTIFNQLWVAIVFGLLWGLLIFNLDRFIVSSMRKRDKKWKEILQASPRIVLAIIIAVVISKPLELKIFEKEIERIILHNQNEMSLQNQDEIAAQFQPEIDRVENKILDLQSEVRAKENEVNSLYETYIAEAEGREGTEIVGKGPVYKEKREKHDQAQRELYDLKAKNSAEVSELNKIVLDLYDQRDSKVSETQPIIDGFNGVMARIQASKDLPLLPQLFILLLFICIETAPIITKLISPKSEYDFRVADRESEVATWLKQKHTQRNELLNAENVVNQRVYGDVAEEEELVLYKRQKARELLHFQTDQFVKDQKKAIEGLS